MCASYRQVLRVLEERAGEGVRGAAHYEQDGLTFLYIREDLKNEAFRERARKIVSRARNRSPLIEEGEGLGRRRAGLDLHEDAVLLHFILGKNSGLIVSLEPEIARQLRDFVEECNLALESPDESDLQFKP